MLDNYTKSKQEIVSVLDEIFHMLLGLKFNNDALNAFKDKIDRVRLDRFNLVVVGQYKRGKTTFINALLGADILPTAIVPLTSIVTIMEYGEQVEATVEFLDKAPQKIEIAALPQYITETENPNNFKNVKLVTITYPSPYLQGGLRLIDTPGIGSVFQHNTDVTYSFLQEVDAAIFLLSADPPISRDECQFLKDITKYVRKIFFIQNKIDLVNEKDREQSMNFSQKIIKQEVKLDEIAIFPLSAKMALEGAITDNASLIGKSKIGDFLHMLEQFLINERKQTLIKSAVLMGKQLLSEATLKIDLEMASLDMPINEIEQKLVRLREHAQGLSQDKQDVAYLLKGELDRFNTRMEQAINKFKAETIEQLKKKVRERFLKNTSRLEEQAINSFLAGAINEQFEIWQKNNEREIQDWLLTLKQRFEAKNRQLIDDMKRLASNLFHVDFTPSSLCVDLDQKSNLYFLTEIPKPMFNSLGGFHKWLPVAWSKQIIIKRKLDELEELVDMNCGRIRHDLFTRTAKTIEEFRRRLEDSLDRMTADIIITIETVVRNKQQGEQQIRKRKSELENIRSRLTALNTALDLF
ncbi:Dynamin family protein [Thermosinus carboxydivorans Nor1]|uniref:Dynamin family protein n=1 Tax=Thermosinus carboxydivorans Nor1 TaxID=401526 RepID=A1HUA5_9FIRM|nr:dynamin family protein [Thermosinus carboxydivorans]EAX46384.1 Dynamin family protein [Thermosinus carboxydivorans Nor1]